MEERRNRTDGLSRRDFLRNALALPVAIGAAALSPAQAEAKTAQVKTVKGSCWRLSVPSYWRKRVRVERQDGLVELCPAAGKYRRATIISMSVASKGELEYAKLFKPIGTIRLGRGRKVVLRAEQSGYYIATMKAKKGKYLLLRIPHYGCPEQGAQPSLKRTMALLQSFGKRKAYPRSSNTSLIRLCVKTVASRITLL